MHHYNSFRHQRFRRDRSFDMGHESASRGTRNRYDVISGEELPWEPGSTRPDSIRGGATGVDAPSGVDDGSCSDAERDRGYSSGTTLIRSRSQSTASAMASGSVPLTFRRFRPSVEG